MSDLSNHLSADAVANIEKWLTEPKYAEYKSEVEKLIEDENWKELEDSFFKVIEFGTAGRRGMTGVGSNRINKVTIGESAQALCEYALDADPRAAEHGIAIACDTRLSSPELTKFTAQVCAANGFKTYVFDNFRSTPELSFAVRHLKTAAGIVISASHNPPLDNGIKVYWSDGAQIASPHDKGILEKAKQIDQVKVIDYDQAILDKVIVVLEPSIDEAYIDAVVNQSEGVDRNVSIVYSPLHGAGQTNVLPALRSAGFDQISVVESQMVPDGNFPTVQNHKPNPEEKLANELAVRQMMDEKADITITNDPDADRIGVMVRQNEEIVYLSGNQSAVLATDYSLKKKQDNGELTRSHYIAKTIVTTDMLDALGDHYGITTYGNMLVGFKYIGELIKSKEGSDETFVIGSEESFGMLKGDYARDKDGATGALPLAEYAAELKSEGKTLYDRLLELYAQHGAYVERLDNVYFEGASGFNKMQSVMQNLQTGSPLSIAGKQVTATLNYNTSLRTDISTGETSPIDCPKGNVFVLEFDNDSRCRITIRPSGTEPKMKFYIQWFESADEDIRQQLASINTKLEELSKDLERQLLEN